MAKRLNGTVTSDKADKTIVITARTRKTHPIYSKQYTVNSKFIAHDEKNEARIGDKVIIVETRPLSARKRYILERITERGGVRFEETDATADIPEEEIVQPAPEEPKADEPKAKSKSKTTEESA